MVQAVGRRAGRDLCEQLLGGRVLAQFSSQLLVRRERRHENGLDSQALLVAAGQRICRRILPARPELHSDVGAEPLRPLGVLGNGGEALVEDVLDAPMVGADGERAAPKVRPPVSDSLDQPDELVLERRQLVMLRSHRTSEEHERR